MRLGMSYIVRDEADIVIQNILYHASLGVDAFAIIDNGSRDGTRELLQQLFGRFDISLFDDPGPLDKERQSMFLARQLREHQGADWLISNDADEFWLPKSGSLKTLMTSRAPVLIADRYNFLPRARDIAADDYRFEHNVMLVQRPYGPQQAAPDRRQPLAFPIMFRTFPGKVACAMEGLRHIHQGNHKIEHEAGPATFTDQAVVYHYQIRTYGTFVRKVRNFGETLQGVTGATSWHIRRWHAMYLAGELRQEYESVVLTDEVTDVLLARGTLREEHAIRKIVEELRSIGAYC